jgi:hypothetical protein
MPSRVLETLVENFEVEDDIVMRTEHRLDFSDWMALHRLPLAHLKDTPYMPRTLWDPLRDTCVFDEIREEDLATQGLQPASCRSGQPPEPLHVSCRTRDRARSCGMPGARDHSEAPISWNATWTAAVEALCPVRDRAIARHLRGFVFDAYLRAPIARISWKTANTRAQGVSRSARG